MARVNPEKRAKMEADGVWESFKRRRAELKDSGDCTPAEANERALAEFYRPDDGMPRGCRAEASPDRADAALGSPPTRNTDDDSELMSKDQALAGCDTSMLKSVKWVASVLGVTGLKPQDAPSPQAWSLYLTYSPRGKWEKFWEKFGTAMMPTKSDIEAKDRFTDDGRKVLTLLDRLEREHDAAIAQVNAQAAIA